MFNDPSPYRHGSQEMPELSQRPARRAAEMGEAALVRAKYEGLALVVRTAMNELGFGTSLAMKGMAVTFAVALLFITVRLAFWSFNSLFDGGEPNKALTHIRNFASQAITGSSVEADLRRQIAENATNYAQRIALLEEQHHREGEHLEAELASCQAAATEQAVTQNTTLSTCQRQLQAISLRTVNEVARATTLCNDHLAATCPNAPQFTFSPAP